MKTYRRVIDLADLPTVTFGRRATTWWGTVGFIVIEATTLLVCAVTYLYLRKNYFHWPPSPLRNPDLLLPTLGAVFLALTNIPNRRLQKATHRFDKRATQVGILTMASLATVATALRVHDFRSLNVHWDTNAYASAAWLAVAFHTTLLALETIEAWVMTALMWFGPVEGKHFPDIEDNCVYWYFMSLVWIPVYALIYVSPWLL